MDEPFEAFGEAAQGSLLDPAAYGLGTDGLADALGEGADDPTLLSGPSAIASLGARARAVAYTRPLHDLEANKVRLGGEAWTKLNLIELGFHTIDVVALQMDFDSGARHDDVISALAALARQQDSTIADAQRVGERVLEGLITGRGGSDASSHQASYGTWGPNGYVAKRFDYALLTEHLDERGEFYLRATDPAISVLMGALDLDVESAQIASELRLNELVKRGRFAAALHEAQRAKYRSIQYANQLQRQISHAQMQTAQPGALAAVDQLIEHALEHVIDRYKAERSIIGNVAQVRDSAEDPVVRRRGNQLIAELEQCEVRHQYLQRRLIRARTEFRHAFAEQLAVGPAPPSRVDLERQLLRPLLEAPLQRADRLAGLLFRLATSPQAPTLVDLDQLIGALCALPPTFDELGEYVEPEDGDLVDASDRRRFDDDIWDAVDELLASVDGPERLAGLLGSTSSDAEAHLLALRALHGFDPALAEHLRQLDPASSAGSPRSSDPGPSESPASAPSLGGAGTDVRLLWWRATGEEFETETLVGDDLVVLPSHVTAHAEAHDER